MTFDIILTLLLVLLNGFFVAAEFAIVKVRSSQIEVKAVRSKSLASAARAVTSNLDGYLAATQLGITLASLGLGWVGESVFTKIMIGVVHLFNGNLSEEAARPYAVPLAFVVITVLHIVFGELAPKSLAIRYPANTTFATAWPLRAFYFIFRPFIWLLNGFANLILRMFGINTVHGSEIHSEEELKMIITESHEGGAIEQTERELIQNVFDFDDQQVGDIMTPRKNVAAISLQMGLKEAVDFGFTQDYTRYPVFGTGTDDIRGIVNMKDMMRALMLPNPPNDISGLVRPPFFVSENRKIKDVLHLMQQRRLQMAIVTDEVGDIAGLLTMEDILEELVGEIQDEYDDETPVVQPNGNGLYIVDAHSRLDDINRLLPLPLPENEEYETLSGYISFIHPDELKKGDVVALNADYQATVLTMFRNSASHVELKLLHDLPNPNPEA